MNSPLRIIIGEDDPDHRDLIVRAIERMGHEILAVTACGRELVELCDRQEPDLVITDVKMPTSDGLDAAKQINVRRPVPIIIVTSHHDESLIQRAQQEPIMAFLVKPVSEANLAPAVAVVMQRFRDIKALQHQNDLLNRSLQDRKVIERAKGLLMKHAQLDEPQAFQRLTSMARKQRRKVAEIAEMVVGTAELISP